MHCISLSTVQLCIIATYSIISTVLARRSVCENGVAYAKNYSTLILYSVWKIYTCICRSIAHCFLLGISIKIHIGRVFTETRETRKWDFCIIGMILSITSVL